MHGTHCRNTRKGHSLHGVGEADFYHLDSQRPQACRGSHFRSFRESENPQNTSTKRLKLFKPLKQITMHPTDMDASHSSCKQQQNSDLEMMEGTNF